MKTNSNKGFTLIELIMVIVILGILAAVAVPKFFDLTTEAHNKNKTAIIGNFRAAIQMHGAHSLATTGIKTYPEPQSAIGAYLDEVPTDWDLKVGGAGQADTIVYHQGDNNWRSWTYSTTSQYDSTGYTIGTETARP